MVRRPVRTLLVAFWPMCCHFCRPCEGSFNDCSKGKESQSPTISRGSSLEAIWQSSSIHSNRVWADRPSFESLWKMLPPPAHCQIMLEMKITIGVLRLHACFADLKGLTGAEGWVQLCDATSPETIAEYRMKLRSLLDARMDISRAM